MAVEFYWPQTTNDLLWHRHALAMAIEKFYGDKAVVNEGYFSVLVIFLHDISKRETVVSDIEKLENKLPEDQFRTGKSWRLPVYYDTNSTDLLAISKHTLLTFETIQRLHQQAVYTVQFVGFLPGFPYLSGLPEILNVPRKQIPNPRIEAGSVAIAAGQCGIYPQVSPGGWYVLGNCPLSVFDVNRLQPNLLSIGDQVTFYPIDKMELERLRVGNIDLNTFVNE